MQLRRALLLFAIVLGLAAIAASVSRPRHEQAGRTDPDSGALPALPGPSPLAPTQVRFPSSVRSVRRRLEADRAASLTVEVAEPGLVQLEGLGLTDSAEPSTPA